MGKGRGTEQAIDALTAREPVRKPASARTVPLDASCANAAASIRHAAQVSVAGAYIGAVVQSATADRVSVITSDPADMRRVAGDRNVTVVTI